ncbi:MAG: hypothetical protein AAFY46_09765, partial [Planctomycetota bacterium]
MESEFEYHGLPFRCFYWRTDKFEDPKDTMGRRLESHGRRMLRPFNLNRWWVEASLLPIWPGLIANLLLWSGAVFLVLSLPGTL